MKISKKNHKRVNKHISLRLPEADYLSVQNLSSQLGLSSSFVMREAIANFLKQNEE